MMNTYYYLSPVGCLELKADNQSLTSLQFVNKCQGKPASQMPDNPILVKTCKQLDEYFTGKRQSFDLPLAPQGTAFQQQVWNALQRIPYGKTISYAELAQAVGNPKACRAVGSANGKNPVAIVIPCHRVINSGGKLGGYAYGLEMKRRLLDLERKN